MTLDTTDGLLGLICTVHATTNNRYDDEKKRYMSDEVRVEDRTITLKPMQEVTR